jgi:hypothetical protein
MAGRILCMLEMRDAFSPRVNRSPTPSTDEIIPYPAKLDGMQVHQGKTVAGLKGADKNDTLLPRRLDLQYTHRKQTRDQDKRCKQDQTDSSLFHRNRAPFPRRPVGSLHLPKDPI